VSGWSPAQRAAIARLVKADRPIEIPTATARSLVRAGVAAPARGGFVITEQGRLHEERDDLQRRREDRRRSPDAPAYSLIQEKQEKAVALMTLIGGPGSGYGVRRLIQNAIEDRVFGADPWPTGKGDAWDRAVAVWSALYMELIAEADDALERAKKTGGKVLIGFDVEETPVGAAEAKKDRRAAVSSAKGGDGVVDLRSYRRGR
jgi:hypothetical protein